MITIDDGDFTVETNIGADAAAVRANLGLPDDAPSESEGAGDPPVSATVPASGEPAEGDGEVEAPAPPESAKPERRAKPRDNPQARISQEIDRRKQAEAKTQALEARLAELEARSRVVSAPPAQVPPTSGTGAASPVSGTRPKPTVEEVGTKYQTYEEFIEDVSDWKSEQRIAALKAELEQREAQKQFQAEAAAFLDTVKAFTKDHPDYEEQTAAGDAALQAAGVGLSPLLAEILRKAGPSVIYWLATHPTDLVQLAKETTNLHASAAPFVRQVLEARVSAGGPPGSASPAIGSTAKPPIKPVGASPVLAPVDDADDEPFEQYYARANARDRKAGRL